MIVPASLGRVAVYFVLFFRLGNLANIRLAMVLLTLIARSADGLILATSIEGSDEPDHNMVKYTNQAKMLFRKLNA
ncbi:unnamed protein product, partial [Gongylonema pulchrum]|uniref:WS_DGAT_C domain-containing protein n=1 Tax=Gongylonema pulchrum TaxID=637853 RepID=A0A183F0X4_9BILA